MWDIILILLIIVVLAALVGFYLWEKGYLSQIWSFWPSTKQEKTGAAEVPKGPVYFSKAEPTIETVLEGIRHEDHPEDDYLNATPLALGCDAYRGSGETLYKVYPLCCDKCKKFAVDILNRYKEALTNQLSVSKLHDWFITNQHPKNNIGNTDYSYLVLVLDKTIPFWEIKNLTTAQITKLINTVKYYWSKGKMPSELGLTNVGFSGSSLVLVNLDLLVAKDPEINPFTAKGSVLINIEPSLFSETEKLKYETLKISLKSF
jgi:hypothetical protein